jgi:hypothetical protein
MAIAPAVSPLGSKEDAMQRDAEVMDAVKRKGQPKRKEGVEKAKNDLRRVIKQVGIDPQLIIQAGKYAQMGLKNPQMYQMALDYAVKAGILTPDQVPKGPGIDYKLLANGITAGRLTEELVKEGAV